MTLVPLVARVIYDLPFYGTIINAMKVKVAYPNGKIDASQVQPAGRSFGQVNSLPRSASHSAPVNTVIQRMPFDSKGTPLTLSPLELSGLDKTQKQLHDDLQKDGTSHVYRDKAAFLEHVQKGKTDAVTPLPGLSSTDFTKGFSKATTAAQQRHDLAPMKMRTTKGGELVDSTSVPEFAKLSEAELPPFPEGTHVYRSQKRNSWKTRNTPTASKNWKMALYHQKPGTPVGYNMLHDDDLVQTRFPYGRGKKRGKREMAGLEKVDTHKATPKWGDTDVVGKQGKKRKLNQPPHEAMVQGHGIDYEHTMDWLGDVDSSHREPDDTLSGSIYDLMPPTKKRKLRNSDQHPANFSPEHPVYGQNFRNTVLGEAEKNQPGGSFIERTSYHDSEMDVDLPRGFKRVRIPRRKQLSVVDNSGVAQKQYALNQTEVGTKRPFNFTDYASIAETHSGKKLGDADMGDLMAATLQPSAAIENGSLVNAATTTGVNSWTPDIAAPPSVKQQLALKHGHPFHFLKPKDFV